MEIKKDYQIKALAKVKKIDFYLERTFEMKYISEKQTLKISYKLDELDRIIIKKEINIKNLDNLYNTTIK